MKQTRSKASEATRFDQIIVSKLRASYAGAAVESRRIARTWEPLSEEAWAKLDELAERRKAKE